MLSLYPRHQFQARNAHDGGDEEVVDDEVDGYNPFYAIAVVCASIFIFCVLAASVTLWKALASAALAALLLGAAGCFAPKGSWFRGPSIAAGRVTLTRATSAELVVTVRATGGPARPGYPCARLMNAPPAFAFQCPSPEADGRLGSRSCEPAGAAAGSSVVVCSVCLEDVRGGEMVRQVPACRHVFHVGCIDMWLHSHGTCPMCRCVVSLSPPPAKAVTSGAAAAEAPESPADDDELPPV